MHASVLDSRCDEVWASGGETELTNEYHKGSMYQIWKELKGVHVVEKKLGVKEKVMSGLKVACSFKSRRKTVQHSPRFPWLY